MMRVPIISLFNNKGGVGKTTFLFHIAHVLADRNVKVLMVDCDSQCNLTAYALHDQSVEQSWNLEGNSIYRSGFGAKFVRGRCDLGFPETSDQAASTAFQSSGIVAERPPNVPVLSER
jgi:MinD superfamily P-loop ATPase